MAQAVRPLLIASLVALVFAGRLVHGQTNAGEAEQSKNPPPPFELFDVDDVEESDEPEGDADAPIEAAPLTPAESKRLAEILRDGVERPDAAYAVCEQLPPQCGEASRRAMRQLDRDLRGVDRRDWPPEYVRLARRLALAMAMTGDEDTLRYLHKVFDTSPERRDDVAVAIAQYALAKARRPHDWPLLVRALPVLEGEDLKKTLAALGKFREKAGAPLVQREVLLAAVRLGPDELAAADELLRHWTGHDPQTESSDGATRLAAWTDWWTTEHPGLPDVAAPVDAPDAKHTTNAVLQAASRRGDPARGRLVFEKANCFKCHRFQDRGESIGPDLTKAAERLQTKEIVESLLHPSQRVHEQYVTQRLTLRDGRELLGIVGDLGSRWVVLPQSAEKTFVDKADVESMQSSPQSAMPSKLLDPLSIDEIVDLFEFLRTKS